jgi:hypothetical protein
MSPKNPSPMDSTVVHWDRPRWDSAFKSHSPKIRTITESLGLGLSASGSIKNRGMPKFDNPDYRQLSSEVARLSKGLPKEREALLDFAADSHSLDIELEKLLETFGPAIWGRDTDRSCLLAPDPDKKTYTRDLFYEDPKDQRILKIYLYQWIIMKAQYCVYNKKPKRPSQADDYGTLQGFGPDTVPLSPTDPQPSLQSPEDIPRTLTPPVEPSTRVSSGKKRQRSVNVFWSGGEEMPSVKRPCQSPTLMLLRRSTRKAPNSSDIDSSVSENVPSVPMFAQSRTKSLSSVTAPVSAREVTPKSPPSNDIARSPSAALPANGFTPKTPLQDALPSDARSYSSPSDSSSCSATPIQSVQKTSTGPHLSVATTGTHSFHATNSPVTHGIRARNSPTMQHTSQTPHPLEHSPQVQVQPTRYSHTPAMYPSHQPSFNQQRHSRVNIPIAPAPAAPIVKLRPESAAHIQTAATPRVHCMADIPVPSVPSIGQAIHYEHQPLLQCEVLGLLMQYLFPSSDAPPNEAFLLHKMQRLWHLGTPTFRKQTGPHYDLLTKVLHSWITERQKIAQLRYARDHTPGMPAAEMVGHLLVMNDLRALYLERKNTSSADGLSAEDLLCKSFAVLTNTEGTEYLFQNGLARLNKSSYDFLRTEDMKIRC